MKIGRQLNGPAGKATELINEPAPGDPPDWQASVAIWFLDCPNQSPGWRHFILGCVHLRPIEGVKTALVNEPGATHEIILYALDPATHPEPLNPDTWGRLEPLNLIQQIIVPSDGLASEILDSCAQQVVDGYLWAEAPLSGQSEPWKTQLLILAEHARGEHATPPTSVQ